MMIIVCTVRREEEAEADDATLSCATYYDIITRGSPTSPIPPLPMSYPSQAPHTEIGLLVPDRCQRGHRLFFL